MLMKIQPQHIDENLSLGHGVRHRRSAIVRRRHAIYTAGLLVDKSTAHCRHTGLAIAVGTSGRDYCCTRHGDFEQSQPATSAVRGDAEALLMRWLEILTALS